MKTFKPIWVIIEISLLGFCDSRLYSDSVREGGCIFTPNAENLNVSWVSNLIVTCFEVGEIN